MSVDIHHTASPFFVSRTSCLHRYEAVSTASATARNKPPQLVQGCSNCGSLLRSSLPARMSATYQPPMPAYDGNALHSYGSALPHGGHPKSTMEDARGSQQCRYPSQHTAYRNGPFVTSNQMQHTSSFQTSKPSTPTDDIHVVSREPATSSRRSSETLIYHSLQIPKCISPNGGNLCDFAAQVRSPPQ